MSTQIPGGQVVIFTLGGAAYAVPIGVVREVVPWTTPMPVPEAPAHHLGVLDLRGELLPVVDLTSRFRLTRQRPYEASQIMVMSLNGQGAGFVVDEVHQVQHVEPSQVVEPSAVLFGSALSASQSPVAGILRLGDQRLAVFLDSQKVISEAALG
ncbi:MAG TPA: chemotaxis protein CheW [Symbiobacteriaceae bacterium]|nr:chemotaxis protein CheW [Symbiobacteriaceae bacterium]